MPHCQEGVAERERIAVVQLLGFEAVLRARFMAYVDFRQIDLRAKLPRTAYEIGVNVRLEDMGDGDILLPRQLDVFVDVRGRIEDGGGSFLIVAQQIRKLRDSFRLDAFKDK